jgi:hypothetical protein
LILVPCFSPFSNESGYTISGYCISKHNMEEKKQLLGCDIHHRDAYERPVKVGEGRFVGMKASSSKK